MRRRRVRVAAAADAPARTCAPVRCRARSCPTSVGLDINRALSCPQGRRSSPPMRSSIRSAACPTAWRRSATRSSACWSRGSRRARRAAAAPPPLPDAATAQVARWEAFLNGDSLKQRITARYLYEHWFVAHLYFEDLPTGPFFRVVRSRTPPGDADRRDRVAAALRRTGRRRASGTACSRSTRRSSTRRTSSIRSSDAKMRRLSDALPRLRLAADAAAQLRRRRGVQSRSSASTRSRRAPATSTCSTTRSTSS